MGKLFIPFDSSATENAATTLPTNAEDFISAFSPARPRRSNPAFCNACTITNKPATRGNTLQEIPLAILSGIPRSRHATSPVATSAATQVGNPSDNPKADDPIRTPAAVNKPASASLPCFERRMRSVDPVNSPRNSFRDIQTRQPNVATTDAKDGSANTFSQA